MPFTFIIKLSTLFIFLTSSTVVMSQPISISEQIQYAHGKARKVEGVDFLVTDYQKHLQSQLSVYGLRLPYSNIYVDSGDYPDNGYCHSYNSQFDPIQKLIVKQNDKVIWQGGGIFNDIIFSENGNALTLTRVYDHQSHHTVIVGDKVHQFFEDSWSPHKEKKDHDSQFTTDHICHDDEPIFFKKISNDGTQILHYVRESDSYIDKLVLCDIKKKSNNEGCEKISTDFKDGNGPLDIAINGRNEIYVLYPDKLVRLDKTTPQWQIPITDINPHYSAKLIIYKNLILMAADDVVNLYDKNSGSLLFTRSRVKQRDYFESFYSIYIREDRMIFQLKGTTDYGRDDIGKYLE